MTTAYIIGIDLQFRFCIDFRLVREQQIGVGLTCISPIGTGMDHDLLFFYGLGSSPVRTATVGTENFEFFPEAKKLGKQLQYANRRGFPIALVIGGSEFDEGQCQVKNLTTGDSKTIAYDADASKLIAEIRNILAD